MHDEDYREILDTEKQVPFDTDLLGDTGESVPIIIKQNGKEVDSYDVVRLLCEGKTWFAAHIVAADKSPYTSFSADQQFNIQAFSAITGKELQCKNYRETHYIPPLF
jgi:hypothetical protein